MTEVMDSLQKAQEAQAQRVERARAELLREQAALEQLNKLIVGMKDNVLVVDVGGMDFAGMGIVEAAEKFLREVGSAATDKIAHELRARGVTTKSKRYTPTVYATLRNSTKFKRVGDVWQLKEAK